MLNNIPSDRQAISQLPGSIADDTWYSYWLDLGEAVRTLANGGGVPGPPGPPGPTGPAGPTGPTGPAGASYTDEQVQDAIGAILVDSPSIDLTYDDATPSIAAAVIANSINNTLLADMATGTVKMRRASAGSGDPTNEPLANLKTDMAFTKADVGLGNVDNTSDINKPVSTATQAALDLKQALDSDLTALAALTGTGLAKRTATTPTWGLFSSLLTVTVFTASGTWTPNANTSAVLSFTTGAGGGGGGVSGVAGAKAGGGGAGATSVAFFSPVSALTVTIGAGGAGGLNTGAAGSGGGTTSFGGSTAGGGGGGGGNTSATAGVNGGSGSSTVNSGATMAISGGSGMSGGGGTAGMTGNGGASWWGGGARGQGAGSGPGTTSLCYGSGGGGATSAGAANAGGDGAPGVVFILEFA